MFLMYVKKHINFVADNRFRMILDEFYLTIGGFNMRFYTTDKTSLMYVPEGYVPFLSQKPENVVVEVRVIPEIPIVLQDSVEVFRASNPEPNNNGASDLLWGVYNYKGADYIVTAEPQHQIFPYLYGFFPESSNNWEIYCAESYIADGQNILNPLAYPMGPQLIYHLALHRNAIMIHASGVILNNKGLIFSGFSGIGKSTMAGLWQTNGYELINDDRLLLRVIDGRCHVFNTPMPYADSPKSNILNHAFLLKQHPENYLAALHGINKLTRIMAYCIQHHYNKEHVQIIMNTMHAIVSDITIHELGFFPDNKVVNLLKNEFEVY